MSSDFIDEEGEAQRLNILLKVTGNSWIGTHAWLPAPSAPTAASVCRGRDF